MSKFAFNPIGKPFDLVNPSPDLSAYLKLNQTTPQTTVGTFTFPVIAKTGGTSSQFLKADGSVDSSTYLTADPFWQRTGTVLLPVHAYDDIYSQGSGTFGVLASVSDLNIGGNLNMLRIGGQNFTVSGGTAADATDYQTIGYWGGFPYFYSSTTGFYIWAYSSPFYYITSTLGVVATDYWSAQTFNTPFLTYDPHGSYTGNPTLTGNFTLSADVSGNLTAVGLGTFGSSFLNASLHALLNIGELGFFNYTGTDIELGIGAITGNNAWISLTESGVANRWIIGIKTGDYNLYINSGSPGSYLNVLAIDPNGTFLDNGGPLVQSLNSNYRQLYDTSSLISVDWTGTQNASAGLSFDVTHNAYFSGLINGDGTNLTGVLHSETEPAFNNFISTAFPIDFAATGQNNSAILSFGTYGGVYPNSAFFSDFVSINENKNAAGLLIHVPSGAFGFYDIGKMDFGIRPDSGQSGYLTFAEDAVADRWAIGIEAGDSNLYFKNGNPFNSNVASLDSSGNFLANSFGITGSGFGGGFKVLDTSLNAHDVVGGVFIN